MIKTLRALFNILPRDLRNRLFLLLVLLLISSVIEALSIGLIAAFALILSRSSHSQTYIPPQIILLLGTDDLNLVVSRLSIWIVLFSLLTCTVRVISSRQVSLSAASIGSYLNTKYFERKFSLDLSDFNNVSKSDILSTIANSNVAINSFITPLFTIFSGAITLILFSAMLLVASPLITTGFLFFSAFAYILIVSYSKSRLASISSKSSSLVHSEISLATDIYYSYRDIHLCNKFPEYINKLRLIDAPLRRLSSLVVYISSLPRYLIESFGLVIVAVLSFSLATTGQGSQILPLLGIVIVSMQKLLPSIQQIYTSYANMKASIYSVTPYIDDLGSNRHKSNLPSRGISNSTKDDENSLIVLTNAIYNRTNYSAQPALDKISLTINPGEKIAVVGPSGSGKSTLLDLLAGFIPLDSGTISYNNYILRCKSHTLGAASSIAYVQQKTHMMNSSVNSNILFPYDERVIPNNWYQLACRATGVWSMSSNITEDYTNSIGDSGSTLSGGQLQRLGLARALARNPLLLLLDESTSALDSESESAILDNIFNFYKNLTLISVTHRLNTLHKYTRILYIDSGRIVADGDLSHLLSTCGNFNAFYSSSKS
jgi:ABC-type multidrug transport system fused ATPase/permease subunit